MRALPWLTIALAAVGLACPRPLSQPEQAPVAEPAPASDLTPPVLDTEWVAVSIAGQPVVAELESWLQLQPDGRITGHAACNSFQGSYRLEGDRIFVGPLATTRMACPDPAMDQERRFLAAIEGADRFEVADGHLLLYPKGSGAPTELAPLAPTPEGDAAITGTVNFRTEEAVPADARLAVRLLDVSTPDAPPGILGTALIEPAGTPPIQFSVAYDYDAIDPQGSYILQAAVLVGDDVVLHTVSGVPVLTGGNRADHVELVVTPVG